MSFSFDPALADNTSLVRFHIGDTNEEGYYIDDETITYWVAQDDVNSAVIACIKYIITQLSKPNFRLDWMAVSDMASAREGFEELLKLKQAELGEFDFYPTSTISQPYRADSLQDSDDSTYEDQ